jgi:hypothetical protein
MSALGLGCVKTYWQKRFARRDLGKGGPCAIIFPGWRFFRAESASDADLSRLEQFCDGQAPVMTTPSSPPGAVARR